jgi:hypothetical protein
MNFYKPDYSSEINSPFARDSENKLIRRSYWLDLPDKSLVLLFNNGIGQHLTNEEKKNHLIDIKRDYLIDKICIQEVIPPNN